MQQSRRRCLRDGECQAAGPATAGGAGSLRGTFFLPVLESAYRDRYDSPWAYSKEYFRTCAQRSAGIASLERLQLPTLCIWNRNIAQIAKARASEGQPVEAVLRQLNFNSRESDQIIRDAYDSASPAYEFVNKVWNQCLGVPPG